MHQAAAKPAEPSTNPPAEASAPNDILRGRRLPGRQSMRLFDVPILPIYWRRLLMLTIQPAQERKGGLGGELLLGPLHFPRSYCPHSFGISQLDDVNIQVQPLVIVPNTPLPLQFCYTDSLCLDGHIRYGRDMSP